MKLLLIDAGNARIKWTVRDEHGMAAIHAFARDRAAACIGVICDHARGVDAIAVSNVAGSSFAEQLREALARCYSGRVWFAEANDAACGIRNAYSIPGNLGVDRWAAMIGGTQRQPTHDPRRPLCIVDAGTALTIDAILADGRHLGGLIVPGIALQRSALLSETSDIAANADVDSESIDAKHMFAPNTATAIEQSGAIACAALVDRCVRELTDGGRPPAVLLTGGDAAALAPWLESRFEICPNLVLEGLALLYEQAGSN